MTLLMRIALIFLSLSLFTATHAYSASNGTCAPGTYLVNEGSGTQSLWTFNKDGTIQVASSAQGALNFSDGQGAWRKWRSRQARVTFLDVNFRLSPVSGGFPPSAIGRVERTLHFFEKLQNSRRIV